MIPTRPLLLLILAISWHAPARLSAVESIGGSQPPRAARSVHLQWTAPECKAFYIEMVVKQSTSGSYFMACGWNGGYFGIQELGAGRKVAILSVWDISKGDNPNAVKHEDRVEVLHEGQGVRIKRFGGEGTGGQCMLDWPWDIGQTNRFLVRASSAGGKTAFAGFIFDPKKQEWRHLVTFRRPGTSALSGLYSFVEDFRRDGRSVGDVRQATFLNGWVETNDSGWQALSRARFTASSADWEARDNINAGVAAHGWFLTTGGETKREVSLNSTLTATSIPSNPPPDLPAFPLADQPTVRPNVVLFLVDDMGWQDTSVPFYYSNGAPVVTELNRKFRTPNMERLARTGMKFTSAYACCVCTPTRVSLMTGLNAARHRVTNWTLRKDTPTDGAHPTLAMPAWNVNGLSSQTDTARAVCAPTLPQLLRRAGYRTILVGKSHLGALGTPGADPCNLGFDVNIAGHAAGAPGSYLGKENYAHQKGEHVWDVPGLERYHGSDTFLTEALTREAIQAVSAAVADGKPFFLYLAHYAVHVPFAPDARFIQKYRERGLDETEARYAALIEGMDKSLGDVLAHLDTLGQATNTVVMFLSDNGGLSAHGRSGPAHTHNAPLSSGKGSAREGGIRVPMLVKWPGVTVGNSVCTEPVIVDDFLPTILDITGAAPAPSVDGVTFVPLLRLGGDRVRRSERQLFWHYPNAWGPRGPGIEPFSAVRAGDWKLIYYHSGPRFELFNLADDIGETRNRLETDQVKARELAQSLAGWLRQTKAQMPADLKSGMTISLPSL